jgi:hypothetical protein
LDETFTTDVSSFLDLVDDASWFEDATDLVDLSDDDATSDELDSDFQAFLDNPVAETLAAIMRVRSA